MRTPFYTSAQCRLRLIRVGLFICIASMSALAAAHNKTVVIPLIGDDIPQEPLEPFAPVTAVAPETSSYFLGFSTRDTVSGLQWQRVSLIDTYDWNAAMEHCADLDFLGRTDWRLPSVGDLISIVSYGESNPAINDTAFTAATPSGQYWSATTATSDFAKAWYVDFSLGFNQMSAKSDSKQVRCVRDEANSMALLENNDDGTVTDLATGLIWFLYSPVPVSHAGADSICDALMVAGKSDWILPSIKELASILDYRISDPSIDRTAFPTGAAPQFWSGTSVVGTANVAWIAILSDGHIGFVSKTNGTAGTLCVRYSVPQN